MTPLITRMIKFAPDPELAHWFDTGDAPPMPEREPLPAVNLARRLRALAAQMDELAGDVMALDEGHWAYGQDLSDWAGIVDEWAAGLAAKDKT